MIYFGLLYIRLSRSHYLNRGFGGLTYLTRVFIDFFYWNFFYFILQHLVDYELGLMNYFGLVCFLWGYLDLMLGSRVLWVNPDKFVFFCSILFLNLIFFIFNL